jgi:hypothetical protein
LVRGSSDAGVSTSTYIDAPDLVGKITNSPFAKTAVPGERGNISVVVSNEGTASAKGRMVIQVYAVAQEDETGTPIEIGRRTISLGRMQQGQERTYTVQSSLPRTLTPGDY